MLPRCWLPRRSWWLGHNQCHGPFNFFPPLFSCSARLSLQNSSERSSRQGPTTGESNFSVLIWSLQCRENTRIGHHGGNFVFHVAKRHLVVFSIIGVDAVQG